MITQREYVEGCQQWYREADLQPGNPEDGEWHECHYPAPKCLGGTETVLLLKEHHAVQGVLQSEEYQHPCIWGWERSYLSEECLERYIYWMKSKGRYSGLKGDRNGKRLSGLKRAAEGHLDRIRSLRNKDTLRERAAANLVKMSEYWANLPTGEDSRRRSRAAGGRPFILTTPQGEEIRYDVISQAERDHNIGKALFALGHRLISKRVVEDNRVLNSHRQRSRSVIDE
jgi:hypothetical protein